MTVAEDGSQFFEVALAADLGGPEGEAHTEPIEHIVKEGESLSVIAAQYNLHSGSILLANPQVKSDLIHPGLKLKIPAEEADEADLEKIQEERNKKLASESAATSTVKKASISSSRGFLVPVKYRQRSRGYSGGHQGDDLAAPTGTPVIASCSGRVVLRSTGWNNGYGNMVLMDCGNGYTTYSAHLSAFAAGLKVGTYYEAGEVIGYVGSTGRSTGPHLHFEIRYKGVPQNPLKLYNR